MYILILLKILRDKIGLKMQNNSLRHHGGVSKDKLVMSWSRNQTRREYMGTNIRRMETK